MSSTLLLYFGHLTYAVSIVAFMFRNMFFLRVFIILASVIAIVYGFNFGAEPTWVPIFWHTAIILVNGLQLTYTYWRRRKVSLNPLESFLYKTALSSFTPVEVKEFVRIGERRRIMKDEKIIEEGSDLDRLYFIVEGFTDILTGKKKVAELSAGYFVGEMSLLTQSKTKAEVRTASDCEFICWPHEKIDAWVGQDPSRLSMLQSALGAQIVEVLLQKNLPDEKAIEHG